MGFWCEDCKSYHEVVVPSSVASACSGVDARQADKARLDAAMEHPGVKDVLEFRRLTAEAAVSPRSSDGKRLLVAQFYFGFLYGMAFMLGLTMAVYYLAGLVAKQH